MRALMELKEFLDDAVCSYHVSLSILLGGKKICGIGKRYFRNEDRDDFPQFEAIFYELYRRSMEIQEDK